MNGLPMDAAVRLSLLSLAETSQDAETRIAAVTLLGRNGQPAAEEMRRLLPLLLSEDGCLVRAVAHLFVAGRAAAVPLLVEAVQSAAQAPQKSAYLRVLDGVGQGAFEATRSQVEAVAGFLRNPVLDVRLEASRVLRRKAFVGVTSSARATLLLWLTDRDGWEGPCSSEEGRSSGSAIDTLAAVACATEVLIPALADPERVIRDAALPGAQPDPLRVLRRVAAVLARRQDAFRAAPQLCSVLSRKDVIERWGRDSAADRLVYTVCRALANAGMVADPVAVQDVLTAIPRMCSSQITAVVQAFVKSGGTEALKLVRVRLLSVPARTKVALCWIFVLLTRQAWQVLQATASIDQAERQRAREVVEYGREAVPALLSFFQSATSSEQKKVAAAALGSLIAPPDSDSIILAFRQCLASRPGLTLERVVLDALCTIAMKHPPEFSIPDSPFFTAAL